MGRPIAKSIERGIADALLLCVACVALALLLCSPAYGSDSVARPSAATDGFTPLMLVTFDADESIAGVYFYHNDHLSTPRALTDSDGTVVWSARYAPFGEASIELYPDLAGGDIAIDEDPDGNGTDITQLPRFPGQWDDGLPGFWYNWHRLYVPDLGMYTSGDPLAFAWFGAYGYVAGNPEGGIDPEGLEWMSMEDVQGARDFADVAGPATYNFMDGVLNGLSFGLKGMIDTALGLCGRGVSSHQRLTRGGFRWSASHGWLKGSGNQSDTAGASRMWADAYRTGRPSPPTRPRSRVLLVGGGGFR